MVCLGGISCVGAHITVFFSGRNNVATATNIGCAWDSRSEDCTLSAHFTVGTHSRPFVPVTYGFRVLGRMA